MSLTGFLLDAISGRRRGWAAALARASLTVPACAFGQAILLRRALYALGVLRSRASPIPVISVGNLTVGGTGKTPLVEYLARGLLQDGRHPAVISRGYGRKADGESDEVLQLREALAGVPVVVNANRVQGCREAAAIHGAQVAILDDGFQHLVCRREVDVVAVDATNPFGYGHLLPRGLLREPIRWIRRAHVIVITRADIASPRQLVRVRQKLGRLAPGAPIALAAHEPHTLVEHRSGARRPVDSIRDRPVACFSGLGNPEALVRTLERLGARIVYNRTFNDHHVYIQGEVLSVLDEARQRGAELVITTRKDAVKLPWSFEEDPTLWVLSVRIRVLEGERELWEVVRGALQGINTTEAYSL